MRQQRHPQQQQQEDQEWEVTGGAHVVVGGARTAAVLAVFRIIKKIDLQWVIKNTRNKICGDGERRRLENTQKQ